MLSHLVLRSDVILWHPYHIISYLIISLQTLYHFQPSENQTYKMQPFCCGGLFVRIILQTSCCGCVVSFSMCIGGRWTDGQNQRTTHRDSGTCMSDVCLYLWAYGVRAALPPPSFPTSLFLMPYPKCSLVPHYLSPIPILPISYSHIPHSLFPVPKPHFPIPYSPFPIP